MTVAAAALVLTAGAPVVAAQGIASAEPAAPQADTQCAENLGGALTQLLNYSTYVTTYLECRNVAGGGFRWQVFDSPYPSSDRWVSYGPKLILHGEGQRNREIDSGDWIAYPQASGTQCSATQTAVVTGGTVTSPQVSTSEPGQPLKLQVLPLLFTIEMSGECLWQKVS